MKKFGDFLKELRKKNGFKSREFAKKINIGQAYLSTIENNKRNAPSIEYLDKMVEELHLKDNEIKTFYDLAREGKGLKKNHLSSFNLASRSQEERREIAKKGQLAAMIKRKERETLKESLLLLLSTNRTQENITTALVQRALEGDVRAFETIRDTIGERQTIQQEIKAEISNSISISIDLSDRITNLLEDTN